MELTTIRNGDYVEYSYTGLALIIPLSGTIRMDVTNVTSTGYDTIMTITGIGAGVHTTHHDKSDVLGLNQSEYGSKVDSEQISTTWGLKNVDKYFLTNGTTNTTTYIGSSNIDVAYRIDTTGTGYSMSVVLTSTNIDVIKPETRKECSRGLSVPRVLTI